MSDRIFTYLPYIGDRFVRVSCQQFMNLIDKDYKNRDYYLLLNKDYCELNNLYQSGLDQLNIEKLFEYKKLQFFLIINLLFKFFWHTLNILHSKGLVFFLRDIQHLHLYPIYHLSFYCF